MALLAQDIGLQPDNYQWEPLKRFAVAQSTIGFALLRPGISYKKRCNIQRLTNRRVSTSNSK